ncbi:MAG: hypothetical protein US25_C0005G0022 [Candidatus Moranbacteria bacterium GW2011_GWE1_36_7]|nr:MAG: hypothetical protein UR99_C0008G0001 [Candidatus Moranbacteria bacterium GW2011_GWD2_36_12]KKQ06847.1 MAG: hypothetical protein US16_C0008G0024 [Candidatus Moranbacteria bacterium GW2011_GWE2_36_40]KKQ15438.1 MAG: hypothetical protein US25_C0005G0022 [Candidatus Moranbacteria bacterium GW2011_GWE1_36_7]
MRDRTLAVLCHVGGFIGCWIVPGIGGILVPLAVWGLGKSPDRTLLDQHGKEAINFQISVLIYTVAVVAAFFTGALVFTASSAMSDNGLMSIFSIGSGAAVLISIALFVFLFIFEAICVILAMTKAFGERQCHYPLTMRLIK